MRKLAPIVFLLLIVSGGEFAARVNGQPPNDNAAEFTPLFNGRDLEGWHKPALSGWKVDDGAFYCERTDSQSLTCAMKLPRDFELVFEWCQDPVDESQPPFNDFFRPVSPAFSITDHFHLPPGATFDEHADTPGVESQFGAGIAYVAAGVEIRFHTRDDAQPQSREHDGLNSHFWGAGSSSSKELARPRGEWNEGRIRCQGSRLQFFLNGEIAYDLRLDDKQLLDDAPDRTRLVVEKWVQRRPEGLWLSVIQRWRTGSETEADPGPVYLKGLRLRVIPAAESLPSALAPRWDWRSHSQFRRLIVPPEKLPVGCRYEAKPAWFPPVNVLPNPGATNDASATRLFLMDLLVDLAWNLAPEQESSAEAEPIPLNDFNQTSFDELACGMCMEEGFLLYAALEADSPGSATTLHDTMVKLADMNGYRSALWRRESRVFILLAEQDVTDRCFAFFQAHIQGYVNGATNHQVKPATRKRWRPLRRFRRWRCRF